MIDRIARLLISVGVSRQAARTVVAILLAAIAFPVLLAFVNVCYWLLSGLWAVSMSSPLGAWGFVGAVTVSFLGAVLIFHLASRDMSKPEIDTGRGKIQEWTKQLELDSVTVSPDEKKRWGETQPLTIDALKQKLRNAMKQAKANRDEATFAAVEAAMDQLREASPDSPEVTELIASERWELDKLKRSV